MAYGGVFLVSRGHVRSLQEGVKLLTARVEIRVCSEFFMTGIKRTNLVLGSGGISGRFLSIEGSGQRSLLEGVKLLTAEREIRMSIPSTS